MKARRTGHAEIVAESLVIGGEILDQTLLPSRSRANRSLVEEEGVDPLAVGRRRIRGHGGGSVDDGVSLGLEFFALGPLARLGVECQHQELAVQDRRPSR